MLCLFLGGLLSRPFRVLNQSLHDFAAGNLDTRISLTRNDEIGEVFDGFNSMAAAIQDRYTEVTDELAQTGINQSGIVNNKIDDSSSTEVCNVQQESQGDVGSELPVAAKLKTNDEPKSDEIVVANSQAELNTQLNKSDSNKQNETPELPEIIVEPQSTLDENPDQTIISTSQITLKIKPQKVLKKNKKREREREREREKTNGF